MLLDTLAYSCNVPWVHPSDSMPVVHVHAIYEPTGARYTAATISDYMPGDRESETEFMTVLAHGHYDAERKADEVVLAINARFGRPSIAQFR